MRELENPFLYRNTNKTETRKELFWDEGKKQQYWIEWIETGNNDIPIKHYIDTDNSSQLEPQVVQKNYGSNRKDKSKKLFSK